MEPDCTIVQEQIKTAPAPLAASLSFVLVCCTMGFKRKTTERVSAQHMQ